MDPKTFKEKVAIYLNEHPEFFNDFPELLRKIQSIDEGDLPLQPLHTLSVADRIIQRVRDDREHIRSRLEWFLEVARKNEGLHGHLYAVEKMALAETDLLGLLSRLRGEITRRFEIQFVKVCLIKDLEYFAVASNGAGLPELIDGALRVMERAELAALFEKGVQPALASETGGKSKVFTSAKARGNVRSEALIPLLVHDRLIGCLALGAANPCHFYEELSTDFLERLAGILALAIDNIFRLESARRQGVIDSATGLFNRVYFEQALEKERARAERLKKFFACVAMSIDYSPNLVDTEKREGDIAAAVEAMKKCCRAADLIAYAGEHEFLLLFPEMGKATALTAMERIRQDLHRTDARWTARCGVVFYPEADGATAPDLLRLAYSRLEQARGNG